MAPRAPAERVPSGERGTGAVPHLKRMAGKLASLGSAKGFLREARGLVTHLALYPLGFTSLSLGDPDGFEDREEETASNSDTFELPVVLLHGYFHNRSGFFFLSRTLRRRGFRWVYGMNYNPLGESIPSLAARLGRHIEDVLKTSGAPRVHLVGHSLGGIIARWYVQEMGGAENVDTCVTIGSPHGGTYAAYAGMGQAAKDMRPGSNVLRRLDRSFSSCTSTTFVNLYSDLDVFVVPPSAALLPEAANVSNHLIRDFGHTSLLISPELMSTVSHHLAAADVHTPLAEVRQLPVRRRALGTAADPGQPG